MHPLLRFFLALLSCSACPLAGAGEVHLAIASNFAGPIKTLASTFKQQTGHELRITHGATGKFYAQIKNGAPFDVLLAADDETPARLEQEGNGITNTRFTYAIGKLVLWSPHPQRVDAQGQVLKRGQFEHLAIANPRLAPYGRAAVEVLNAQGLHQSTQNKWVMGENIAQTYQFVATGNAELGFVALSQVQDQGKIKAGSAWIVPSHLHSPIRQDAILLKHGQNNPAARAFLTFLQSATARQIISAAGYGHHSEQ